MCQLRSCRLLRNCRNKLLYNSATTNQSSGDRRLQLTDVRVVNSHDSSCRCSTSSTVDEFRWQHDRFAVAKFFNSRVWEKFRSEVPVFSKTPDFPLRVYSTAYHFTLKPLPHPKKSRGCTSLLSPPLGAENPVYASPLPFRAQTRIVRRNSVSC